MSDHPGIPAPAGRRDAALMPRPRVAALLSGALDRRVTLMVAGAGYGKTTALADLAERAAARWVRLRPADAQAESLAGRIAAALGEPSPERSPIAAATGSDDRQVLAEGRAAMLCELANALTGESLLIVDALECIGDDPAASHLLRVLSLEIPPHLHLLLSGRSLPDLGLGGEQGHGELLEITAPDLSFTVAEVAELVARRLGDDAAVLAQECWSLTEGWPAALQLLLDRLVRLDRADHDRELARLRHSRGHVWRAFARDLVAAEHPMARRVLHVASLSPRVDARLLQGVGVSATTDDLTSLRERGLLVEAGALGYHRLSPVLAGVVSAERGSDAAATREQVARWLEDDGQLDQALECYAGAAPDQARSFVRRHGLTLIRAGAAARLIDVLRQQGTGEDPVLEAVLAEALQAVGDWDAAIELFMRLQHSAGPAGLPAAVAWRYGVLLYLRGQSADAAAILSATHDPGQATADDAMVSACLSTTLWSQGQSQAAADLAATALRQASASGDACALAAAHVSVALAAASLGERERNEQSYRLALAAARDGGDLVQLARIHANLSSRALENGEYSLAIAEAELALETGAGHRFFAALALTNKAEAHLRLGQLDNASAAAAGAAAMYDALGSLHASIPQVIFGELYRLRGDMVRARGSFERARGLAAEADDAHTAASALIGLARVLAEEDVEAARSAAAQAVAMASSLERAAALCAAAEVELRASDGAAAVALARKAEKEARATGDRAALAEAFELQGAAQTPGDEDRLRAAIGIWADIGNTVGSARARLAYGLLIDDRSLVDEAERSLTALGAAPAVGVPALIASSRGGREVAILTLGRFAVLHGGDPVPLAAWQSRKARDLLKLLVARRGRPVTREAAAEAMWPGEDPVPLSNRLSVALSTLRKVLDPTRQHAADHYLIADARTIALRLNHLDIDLIEFLTAADRAIDLMAKGDSDAAAAPLQRGRQLYAGDFLEEDLYEDWAVEAREEARSRLLMILRLLARLATDRGDDESAGQYLGQLLEREPYDENAWLALIAGQLRLRRHGEARRRYAAYARRMAELDVVPVPLTDAASWRP
ncbi:MAG TPA: BTAD domain-containing putative transcriptional regulator [Streptosporangiaceae bacterium]|nr:BTAD domain-containing putative transcriptional regulator [Streptosporangiaceae bacterium]